MPNPPDLTQRLRAATAPDPEVDAALRDVQARVRRRATRRRVAVLATVALVVGIASLWVVRSDDSDKQVLVGPPPATTDPRPNDAAPTLNPLWTGEGLGMSASFGASSGDLTAASSDAVFTATGFGSTSSTGDSGQVTAVDRDTGGVRWTAELNGPAFIQGVIGTTVIANNQEDVILGLDAADGTVRWEVSLAERGLDGYGAVTSAVGEPVSAIGLSATNEGDVRPPVVIGVDTNTGEVVWTTPLEPGTDLTFGTPPVDGGQTVFVSTLSHPGSAPENLAHLIDIAAGSIEWEAGMGGGQGFGDLGAVIDGPFVHLPAEQEVLTVNRDDGSTAWTRPGRGAVHVNDHLWIIGSQSALERLDPATGELLSTIPSPVADPMQIVDLGNGALGVISRTSMAGIDADGRQLFSALWPSGLVDSVRVDNPLLVVATGDTAVSAYSLDEAPTRPTNSPEPASVTGTLSDGRSFTLLDDSQHGLCLTIDDVNIGCDDVGPVITDDDDPTTARGAGDVVAPHALVYGYLPDGAVDVYAVLDQNQRVTGATVDLAQGLWALPLPEGYGADDPVAGAAVVYVLADGTEVPAPARA